MGYPTRGSIMKTTMSYSATLDSKNRLVIRKPLYKYYKVSVLSSGAIVLEPQKLVPAMTISKETLDEIDSSVASLKENDVSGPVVMWTPCQGHIKKKPLGLEDGCRPAAILFVY